MNEDKEGYSKYIYVCRKCAREYKYDVQICRQWSTNTVGSLIPCNGKVKMIKSEDPQ